LEVRFDYEPRLVSLVKSLPGRQWVNDGRYWSVPEAHVVAVVDLLKPEGFRFCTVTWRLYKTSGGTIELDCDDAPAALAPANHALPVELRTGAGRRSTAESSDFTVSRLNGQVNAALSAVFQAPIWLVGEVSGFAKSAHKNIVGFELIERAEDGGVVSQVRATLFESARRQIDRRLRAAGYPFQLDDEIQIRVRGRVEVYVPWGLYRFVVDDIDPAYTLGEAARRREEVRRRLVEEGILERNRSLPLPLVPLRVGLVTSLNSDAYNDVLHTLEESGFAFRVVAHGARVQGRYTEPSVLNALDRLRERRDDLDVVLICRGGGSQTDLAWFDSEAIARAVALFPIPVLIGIGHEKDISALDYVARRAKTPTAAAAELVAQVERGAGEIEQRIQEILEQSSQIIEAEARAARERSSRLVSAAQSLLQGESTKLEDWQRRTARGTTALLRDAESEIARWAGRIPRVAALLLDRRSSRLKDAVRQLHRSAGHSISSASRRLHELSTSVRPRASRRLELEIERSEARGRRLRILDPRRVLERGYAILRMEAGVVVTDPALAPTGTKVIAELKGGTLRLRSEGSE
jgi:exodeoxyribonuclease VII large subunit